MDQTKTKKAPVDKAETQDDDVTNKTTETSRANSSSSRQGKGVHSKQIKDGGHTYGNFHNYYAFNPVEERMSVLGRGILDFVVEYYVSSLCPPAKKKARKMDSEATINYLDVGCNEGNLTMAVSEQLLSLLTPKKNGLSGLNKTAHIKLKAHGWDMDPVLVQRANRKTASHIVPSTFRVANVLSDTLEKNERFYYLTSVFSTTMWIHIHGGDDGLRRVLGDLCAQTEMFLLIEPQPSKCYRSAMGRLRKMGLPELDVSTDRLRLRSRIEQEINTILNQNSFQRVILDFCGADGGSEAKAKQKTSWNRSILLYQRVSQGEESTVAKKREPGDGKDQVK